MSDQQQPPVYKIALGIEYDGSKYYGWQRQNEVRSVQEKLEKALSQVANEPITVFCATASPSSMPLFISLSCAMPMNFHVVMLSGRVNFILIFPFSSVVRPG